MAARHPCDVAAKSAGGGDRRTVLVRASYAGAASVLGAVRPQIRRGALVAVVLTPPGPVDLKLLDALAELALWVRRSCGELQLCADDGELHRLVELAGLSEVLAVRTCSGQPRGKAQPGEQLGAQEVVDVPDPPA